MRVRSSTLKTRLAENPHKTRQILTFTLTDGTVFRFTDRQVDHVIGGDTWQSEPGFKRSAITLQTDGAIWSMDLEIGAGVGMDITPEDLLAGRWDSATAKIDAMIRNDTAAGIMPILVGYVGTYEWTDQEHVRFEVTGKLDKGRAVVVETVGPTCRADTYDLHTAFPRCRLDRETWKQAFTVASVTSGRVFDTALAGGEDWYSAGVLLWVTGDNAGRAVEIRNSTSAGLIELWLSPKHPVQVGDTGFAWPGDDKTFATCRDKFSNQKNFQGEPRAITPDFRLTYTPPPERVVTETTETITDVDEVPWGWEGPTGKPSSFGT